MFGSIFRDMPPAVSGARRNAIPQFERSGRIQLFDRSLSFNSSSLGLRNLTQIRTYIFATLEIDVASFEPIPSSRRIQ